MSINVDSNAYTLGFATIIVVGVALLLSGFSELVKERYKQNVILDKKMSIMSSVDKNATKENTEQKFNSTIKSLIVNSKGESQEVNPLKSLDIDLRKELKKPLENRSLPLYVYTDNGKTKYILPMHGNGLWDFIGGYLAIKPDFNTLAGALFTHVGETPGLGAEMTKDWFQDNFIDEKLMKDGEFIGIKVLKGKGNKANAELHKVDGMSGATITGDGIEAMIETCVKGYLPYFKKNK